MGEAISNKRLERIPSMDGMRFLMCLGIAALHFSFYFLPNEQGNFQYVQHLAYFTDIFFIISGFFLARSNINKSTVVDRYAEFIFLRAARLYPLYLATLLFYVLVAVLAHFGYMNPDNPDRYDLSRLAPHVFLVQSWGIGTSLIFNYPTWSLSALWLLYIVFPLIFIVARRSRTALAIAVGVALIIGTVAADKFCPGDQDLTTIQHCNVGIFRAIPSFLYGVFLAFLGIFRIKKTVACAGLMLTTAALFLPPYLHIGIERLLLIYALIFFFLSADYAGLKTPLSSEVFGKKARYSYGIYLIHPIIATVFASFILPRTLDLKALYASSWGSAYRIGFFAASLILSYGAAKIAFHSFENPIYRAAERLIGAGGQVQARSNPG
jgi:peptidoglycan/LPS O-acetylase OafA/YrhL